MSVKRRWLPVLALGLVVVALARPSPVRADCVDYCGQMWAGAVNEAYDACYREYCVDPKLSYGAIAYGARSRSDGFSFGRGTADNADRDAMYECAKFANDCKVVVTFSNSCAALAVVESTGDWALGRGAKSEEAQAKAMIACASAYGVKCQIKRWVCAER